MKILKCLLTVVVVFLLVPSAFASRITGDITIVGDPWVRSATGDFDRFAPKGSVATYATPWRSIVTDPSSFSLTVKGLTFGLTSSTTLSNTSGSLTATGTGMVSGNGFDSTAGNWTFTAQRATGTVFGFTAVPSNGPAAVPDTGSTFGLLAIALAVLVGTARASAIGIKKLTKPS